MSDIVSRIKLEATGGDQAAREILKLKEAYEETGKAARSISPEGIGAGDPFSRATSTAPTVEAVQSTTEREARNARYRQQQEQRESDNRNYGIDGRRFAGVAGGISGTAQQVARGQYAGAAGGALAGLGGLLGGATLLGGGLLAGGLLMKGIESLAGNAFERLERYWGSGVTQRLGVGFRNVEGFAIQAGRTGIPAAMINTLLQSASVSGFNPMAAGGESAAQWAVELAGNAGVDPSLMGRLIGGASRAGITGRLAGAAGYDLYRMGTGTFGVQNMNTFLTELSRTLETAMERGVQLTGDEFDRTARMLGGLTTYGGFSPTGAAAVSQSLQQRGMQAANLQRPEDVIAFQALRAANPTKSMTDIMLMMEERPLEVSQQVYQHLRRTTGGDEDLLRLRMQAFTGMSMAQTARLIETYEGLGEGEELPREFFRQGRAEEGKFIATDPARRYYAAQQQAMLKGVEDFALNLKTGVVELLTGGKATMDIRSATFERIEYTGRGKSYEEVGAETVQDLLESPELSEEIFRYYRTAWNTPGGRSTLMTSPEEFSRIIREQGAGAEGTLGGWGDITTDIWGSLVSIAQKQIGATQTGKVAEEVLKEAGFSNQYGLQGITDQAEAIDLLRQIVRALESRGVDFVFTDGGE